MHPTSAEPLNDDPAAPPGAETMKSHERVVTVIMIAVGSKRDTKSFRRAIKEIKNALRLGLAVFVA